MELWIAREILSKPGNPTGANQYGNGTIVPVGKTWNSYCEETGILKRTANRWLRRWTTREEINPFFI